MGTSASEEPLESHRSRLIAFLSVVLAGGVGAVIATLTLQLTQ